MSAHSVPSIAFEVGMSTTAACMLVAEVTVSTVPTAPCSDASDADHESYRTAVDE
ncbi:hypothetical protein ACNS7O_17650 (plasmid) [Haloferacaceae archaeon DSL9]